ncbi:hypothetical protein [Ostreiculturibacter nitratireducens]|uniref:hypothetical protein n=1 Tax=Ostreiculturibacter nitratireducens TaxID=3075226 RepID=UPI0031B64625
MLRLLVLISANVAFVAQANAEPVKLHRFPGEEPDGIFGQLVELDLDGKTLHILDSPQDAPWSTIPVLKETEKTLFFVGDSGDVTSDMSTVSIVVEKNTWNWVIATLDHGQWGLQGMVIEGRCDVVMSE